MTGASLGNAAATASSVRLRDEELAATAVSAAESSSSVTPGAGTVSMTRSDASVSVPVLSTQIVSTDAIDSIAFSCWASTPRRDIRTEAAAYVRLISTTRPSGIRLTTPAEEVETAVRSVTCRW